MTDKKRASGVDALLILGIFLSIMAILSMSLLCKNDMYNIDGLMSTTPYVVHIGTKKLQLQKNIKAYIGFALGIAVCGGKFNTVQDRFQDLVFRFRRQVIVFQGSDGVF